MEISEWYERLFFVNSYEKVSKKFIEKNSILPRRIQWGLFMEEFSLLTEDEKNYSDFSMSPYITLEFIKRHFSTKYNFFSIGSNFNFTIKDMEALTNIYYINTHQNLYIEFNAISTNPNITIDFIRKYPNINPYTNILSCMNPAITPEIMESNRDMFPLFEYVLLNPHITLEFLRKHSKNSWNAGLACSLEPVTDKEINSILCFLHTKVFRAITYELQKKSFTSENYVETLLNNIKQIPNGSLFAEKLLYLFDRTTLIKHEKEISDVFCEKNFHDFVSENIHVSILKQNPKFFDKINWELMSKNKSVSLNFYLQNRDKNWNRRKIFENLLKFPVCSY